MVLLKLNKVKTKEFYIKIIIIVISIIFSISFLEIILRIISPMPKFGPYFDLRPYKKLRLYFDLKGVSSPVWHTANKWGMRGDEPPLNWEEYYTILTIGGSSTQCFYLDDKKTWPYLLQEKLKKSNSNVWIGNAGLDGHSTRSHILMMDKVVKELKPDLIIFLVGINDLERSLSEDVMSEYHTRFVERMNKRSFKLYAYEHSRLVQILYIFKWILGDRVTVVKRIGHSNYVPEKMIDSEILPHDLKEMLPSLSDFKKNIVSIVNIAEALNIRVIFLTQPCLYEDNQYWSSILAKNYWIKKPKHKISAATKWRMLQIFNYELLQICKEQKVECIDLASKIPHNFEYFYGPCHFTEKGAELVSSKVAVYLIRNH